MPADAGCPPGHDWFNHWTIPANLNYSTGAQTAWLEGQLRTFRNTNGIDFNGHNHVYERADPIRGGVATTQAPIGATIDR